MNHCAESRPEDLSRWKMVIREEVVAKAEFFASVLRRSLLMHGWCGGVRHEATPTARFLHAGAADGDALFRFKTALSVILPTTSVSGLTLARAAKVGRFVLHLRVRDDVIVRKEPIDLRFEH